MAAPALTRHVDDLWPELADLFSAGERARQVVQHPGWDAALTLIEREIATVQSRLENAVEPLTRAEYAYAHGRIGGLKALEGAAEAILTRSEKRYAEQAATHEGAAESVPQEV